jgi:hypothetical protein
MGREFITVEEVSKDSRFVDATIKSWFADMTDQERSRLVDVLFTLLGSGGVESTLDILHPKNTLNYLKVLSMDDNMRKVLSGEFQSLIEAARRTRARFADDREALEAGTE